MSNKQENMILPYGDTLNDGKVQLSFTLPIMDNQKGVETAKVMALSMGLENVLVAHHQDLGNNFTFYIVYGEFKKAVDYDLIKVVEIESDVMSMVETDAYIKDNIGRKIIVLGASTGSDAHTVGIDAIMNMKGFAGHYGLERYQEIEAINLGSQVENEEFIEKAIAYNADVLLVSQTVTQKDVHLQNLTNLVELLEANNLRDKVMLICGGPRITHELAKELGYDAGFGTGKFADDVASYIAYEMVGR
ncbi:MAG: cobalamin B12-binding domain-containing protein [Bacilli bacterium]